MRLPSQCGVLGVFSIFTSILGMLVNKDLPWHAALIIFVACPQSEYFVVYKIYVKSLSSAAQPKENTCVPVKNLQKSIENTKAQTCVLIAVSISA